MKCIFETGDVVQLKSGSPKMTVVSVVADAITVVWIHYNTGNLQTVTVPAVCLVAVTPKHDD